MEKLQASLFTIYERRYKKRQNFKSIERSAFFVVRTPIDRTNKPTPEASTESINSTEIDGLRQRTDRITRINKPYLTHTEFYLII